EDPHCRTLAAADAPQVEHGKHRLGVENRVADGLRGAEIELALELEREHGAAEGIEELTLADRAHALRPALGEGEGGANRVGGCLTRPDEVEGEVAGEVPADGDAAHAVAAGVE